MSYCLLKSRALRIIAITCAIALPGCASFTGKPPLPKQASIEHAPKPAADADYPALVASADIIYFPVDRAGSGAQLEPSALLVDALQKNGTPFAIAWDLIEATQQPLLDQLRSTPAETRDEMIGRLDLIGTGRAREHCRSVLRDNRFAGIQHLALRCPAPLLAKARDGALSGDDRKQLPSSFDPPPGGVESYAERLSSRRSSDSNIAGDYRMHLVRQQFAAARIIEHFRSAGPAGKLLVFLREEDLLPGEGVPRYVAQKLKLRQLVLGSANPNAAQPKLLTGL
jgi:hypothetical protein